VLCLLAGQLWHQRCLAWTLPFLSGAFAAAECGVQYAGPTARGASAGDNTRAGPPSPTAAAPGSIQD
jgi:hypothetical protein